MNICRYSQHVNKLGVKMFARKIALTALTAAALIAPATAQAATPEHLAADTAAWLTRQGFPVEAPAIAYEKVGQGTTFDYEGQSVTFVVYGRGAAVLPDKTIVYAATDAPALRSLAKRYGRRGTLTQEQREAAETLVHELLHQPGLAEFYSDQSDAARSREEGVVEQVARDLLPAYVRAMFGDTIRGTVRWGSYGRETAAVRKASAKATGKAWTSYAARKWRAAYLLASHAERVEMAS